MGTTQSDVAYDAYLASLHGRRRPRDRRHEDSSFVRDAVLAWLVRSGATVVRVHPQEVMAGKSPLGACVLIHMQAARTRVAASVHRMTTRSGRDPMLRGVPMAVALPDLPRLREAARDFVARAPRPPVVWLFVDRCGRVAAVPPPRDGTTGPAAGPA